MDELRQTDDVAYVRFASVYRRFQEATDFVHEVKKLGGNHDHAGFRIASFQMATGESVPYSADMVALEVGGVTIELFDAEFVRHATKAVFHYFKHELGRQTVSVGEFAGALEKVLCGFADAAPSSGQAGSESRACWNPICRAWHTNPARAASCSFFRACGPNCASNCGKRRACCAFTACAAVSSNWPARGVGACAAGP